MNEKKRRREAADSGTVSGNISGFCRFHEADFKDSLSLRQLLFRRFPEHFARNHQGSDSLCFRSMLHGNEERSGDFSDRNSRSDASA
jgi:hypothetical protein